MQQEECEGDKDRERDYLLQELELIEGDSPAHQNGQRNGPPFQNFQPRVEIPGTEHEEVGGDEQGCSFEKDHDGCAGFL